MSLSISDKIKTPFEQLDEIEKLKLVDFYMQEHKADIIEMYLHSMNAETLVEAFENLVPE